jgi:hypothetical protein
VAAQRAQARRAEIRRRVLITGGSIAAVLAIVIALIVVKTTSSSSPPPAAAGGAQTNPAVASQVTSVPGATFDAVGAGTAAGLKRTSGQPLLTQDGKPELLYMGGEFCPYCAAERWALAAAVSRFGTLSGLRFIHSSPTDVYPSTPTLSFAKASYTSKYLAFAPVEWYGQAEDASTPLGHVLPAAPDGPADGAVQQVRRRRDPVRRRRQPVPGAPGPVRPERPGRPELVSGRRRDARSVQPGRQGHRRGGKHDHRGDLQAHPRPAR